MKHRLVFIIMSIPLAVIIGALALKSHIKAFFYIDHMERHERTGRMNVDRIVDSLRIARGDSVVDIGAGEDEFFLVFRKRASQ